MNLLYRRIRPLIGKEKLMLKHYNVFTEFHSQIPSNWKNGRNSRKRPPNVIIVKLVVNKSCSFSMNYRLAHASFYHVEHSFTIHWSIFWKLNIENVDSKRWSHQTFTMQNFGKRLAIGSTTPKICSRSNLKRKHSHWNRWIAPVIVSFSIIVIVLGVSYHFVWLILVFCTVMNCPELCPASPGYVLLQSNLTCFNHTISYVHFESFSYRKKPVGTSFPARRCSHFLYAGANQNRNR